MTTNLRIAYNITNVENSEYKLNVCIIDKMDKIIKSIDKMISVEDFNATIYYDDDEKELINKANELVKLRIADNIANILKDDINEFIDNFKQSTTT